MILVDSSVWIDFFLGNDNPQVDALSRLLTDASSPIAVADLVIFEVLRGFKNNKALFEAQSMLCCLPVVEIGGLAHSIAAAELYRNLRKNGITITSGIDVLQASYCIERGHTLLHRDSDFQLISTLKSMVHLRH
jgi:predicted nucleic acid-binding protein